MTEEASNLHIWVEKWTKRKSL